jgi:hypothetical protein
MAVLPAKKGTAATAMMQEAFGRVFRAGAPAWLGGGKAQTFSVFPAASA